MSVREKRLSEQRGKKQGKGSVKKVEWQGFLLCNLTPEHKKELAAQAETDEVNLSTLCEVAESGYKIGLSYSSAADAFVATLQDVDVESDFAGYMLSGWGSTPETAIRSLLFKHLFVWADGWVLSRGVLDGQEYG